MNAELHIQAALRNGITYLKHAYATPPFKVANITEDKRSEQLNLMMMCSSPGVLDNDVYELKISLNENCNMQLHTQSYQRLFHMRYGAIQSMEVCLSEGASFIYLPHAAVPHERSIFTNRNKIYLERKCSLIWGEILTCGRQLKDEVFTFSKYHSVTEIFIENKLVIKENLLMQPALFDPLAIGQLEGFTHQASLICLSEYGVVDEAMNAVYEYLSLQTKIEFGVSKTVCKGFIVRILGYKAEQLHNCLTQLAKLVQEHSTVILNSQ